MARKTKVEEQGEEAREKGETLDPSVNWLTPQQVATTLQVNQQTVRNWLRDGLLEGAKFGDVWRIHRGVFDAFILESQFIHSNRLYDPGPVVKNQVKELGYRLIQGFGHRRRAVIYVDVAESQNEVGLVSQLKYEDENLQQRIYEGWAFLEDASSNPYDELYVTGASNVDVFAKLLQELPRWNLDVNPILIQED